MLEWVCPKCGRGVDPALTACPFCGFEEKPQAGASAPAGPAQAVAPGGAAAASAGAPSVGAVRRVVVRRKKTDWGPWLADVERGFRFGLGFVASLAVTYFVLYLIAHYGGYGEWANRLARWLQFR